MGRLVRFAWFVLGFNVLVILLGATVRATGSGAGCGESWPTCHGELLPELSGSTAVEFTHRSMSGVALILVAVLAVWVWRVVPKGEPARIGSAVAMVSIVGEALIGAAIVLSQWVADDDSVARAVAVPLHLVNTLLLLAALTLTIFYLNGGQRPDIAGHPRMWRAVLIGGVAIILIAATGAITALADTLFPKEGLGVNLAEGSHFLTRLRIVHPILAVIVSAIAWLRLGGSAKSRSARAMVVLVAAMLFTGVLNVALGVPVWMQLLHLALADALWIAFVLAAASALAAKDSVSGRLADPLVAE